ncbi:hypothetical protein SDC9_128661 [bioreactor metagenome]|uniref:Uncharacterized protein n=1 Tax=bioreactor metagenome TaxID=1076179 RepID=A0A645CXM3_9ZZZZ
MPVALETQHDVDQVLQGPGARDRAVLGDVSDDDHRQMAGLGDPDQRGGHLADLGDPTGRTVGVLGRHRLHGVDDEQCGGDLLDVAEDGPQVTLGRQVELLGKIPGAFGAHPHLGDRLLAGHVQRAASLLRPGRRHLQQQGRLADTRLAGQQHHRAGHQAAAEHPVQFAHPGHRPVRGLPPHLGDGHGLVARRDRSGRLGQRAGARPLLHHGAPLLALTAAADPFRGGPPALGTDVRITGGGGGLRSRHGCSLERGADIGRWSAAGSGRTGR